MAKQAQVRVARPAAARGAPSGLGQGPLPFILPAVVYLLAFSLFPLVWSLLISFQEYDFKQRSFTWVGLANYAQIFRDADFRLALRNTVVFTASTVALELVLGLGLALFMNRRIPARGLLRSLLILPMVTTPMVVGLMWRFLLNTDFGVVNYLLKTLFAPRPVNWVGSSPWSLMSLILVDVWQWTPFAFLILYAGLQTIQEELLEAARIDGAGSWSLFRYLILPLLTPMVTLVILFRAIDSWRAFDTIFSLTYGAPGRS